MKIYKGDLLVADLTSEFWVGMKFGEDDMEISATPARGRSWYVELNAHEIAILRADLSYASTKSATPMTAAHPSRNND
jgi:hypothetical protein